MSFHFVRVAPKPELDQLAHGFPKICVAWVSIRLISLERSAFAKTLRPIAGTQAAYVRSRHRFSGGDPQLERDATDGNRIGRRNQQSAACVPSLLMTEFLSHDSL